MKEKLLAERKGVFDVVNGVLVGKHRMKLLSEYKDILIKVIGNEELRLFIM